MEGQAVFCAESTGFEKPQLIKPEQNDQKAANTGKPGLIFFKKLACGSESEAKQEESAADAEDKT